MARKNNSPVKFHGAFSSKADAEKRAKKVGGSIKEITVRGKTRYTVETKR